MGGGREMERIGRNGARLIDGCVEGGMDGVDYMLACVD